MSFHPILFGCETLSTVEGAAQFRIQLVWGDHYVMDNEMIVFQFGVGHRA